MSTRQPFPNIHYPSFYLQYIQQPKQYGHELVGLCPFHPDHHPSFSVNLLSGLFKCHACGAQGNVISFFARFHQLSNREAAKQLRLQYCDTVSSHPSTSTKQNLPQDSVRETVYPYRRNDGSLLYEVVRKDFISADGAQKKQIFCRVPSPLQDGSFSFRKPKERVLYRLPELCQLLQKLNLDPSPLEPFRRVLWIVEGEKCADALWKLGCPATTTGSASSFSDWDLSASHLAARFDSVLILPDNDPPGLHYASEIAARLLQHGVQNVRILDLRLLSPHLPQKADIFDLLQQGTSISDVFHLAISLPLLHQTSPSSDRQKEIREQLLSLPCNDLGNAARFLLLFGDQVLFCPDVNAWFVWDLNCWTIDRDGQVWRWASQVVQEFRLLAVQSDRLELKRFAILSGNVQRIRAMLELVSKERFRVQDQLDQDLHHVIVQNGKINLTSAVLSSPSKEDYITKRIAFPWIPESQCPRFLQFLDTIFDSNLSMIQYIQRVFGYCLSGSTQEQVFFIAFGSGANGKSTLIDVISFVLREYVHTIPIDVLLQKDSPSSASPELARARGARLLVASENSSFSRLNEGQIKQLTGSDRIAVRPLYSQGFSFLPQFKIWISTNHKPHISGSDYGIWRRIHCIPFSVTIPESLRDQRLAETLREEAVGIFRWIVEGAKLWYQIGLDPPSLVLDAVKEYRNEEDVFQQFLSACVSVCEGASVRASDLYASYRQYCRRFGIRCQSQTAFGRQLSERGFQKEKNPFVHYQDLSLRQPNPDPDPDPLLS